MSAGGIVKKGADWVAAIEAAYDPAPSDVAWGDHVTSVAKRIVAEGEGWGLAAYEHNAECTSLRQLVTAGDQHMVRASIAAPPDVIVAGGPASVRAFFYPPLLVTTHSEIERTAPPALREVIHYQRRRIGFVDCVGVVVHPEPGVALVLCGALGRELTPSKTDRRALSQLGLHLAAAFRLRRRPEALKTEISLEGPGRSHTVERARRIEASRSRATADRFRELWTALVEGRYSLVPRVEGRRRRFLVLENPDPHQPMRALTPRQVEILSKTARGMSNKLVAYALGLAPSTVSQELARATAKLGLSSRLELVRLAATIGGDPRVRAVPETLSAVESEILEFLRDGLSNHQIARLRSRSVHTIANQVASLLRKTESDSRRAAAAIAGRTEP